MRTIILSTEIYIVLPKLDIFVLLNNYINDGTWSYINDAPRYHLSVTCISDLVIGNISLDGDVGNNVLMLLLSCLTDQKKQNYELEIRRSGLESAIYSVGATERVS